MSSKSGAGLRSSSRVTTGLLIALVVAMIVVPLVMNGDARFTGTDEAAKRVIVAVNPAAEPWFQPPWSPPSREVESFLFSLQAALGGGVIGYCFGRRRR